MESQDLTFMLKSNRDLSAKVKKDKIAPNPMNLTFMLKCEGLLSIEVKRDTMNQGEKILQLAKENRGFFTSKMVDEAGLSRGSLKYLLDTGKIEKTARGVYITVEDTFEDEWWALQQRYGKGIFSLGTSLFLDDLSDRCPVHPDVCFPRGYNVSRPKNEGINCHTVDKDIHSLGVIEAKSICKNPLRIYCPERTLAEILRPQNAEDIAIIVDAFNWYVSRRNKNIPLLSHYGKIFKVEKRLRHYLEVLL